MPFISFTCEIGLLDALITELCSQAKRAEQRKRLHSLRDLDAAARQLGKVAGCYRPRKFRR